MTNSEIKKSNHNEEISSYLKRKLEHYEEILKITTKQEEAIKSDNTKELNLLITEKEIHIKNIKRLMNFNNSKEEIILGSKHILSDNRINALLRKIQSLITNLLSYDQNSIKLISSSIDGIKTKKNTLNKRRRVLKTLRLQQNRTPSFVDVVQ